MIELGRLMIRDFHVVTMLDPDEKEFTALSYFVELSDRTRHEVNSDDVSLLLRVVGL